MEIGAYLLIDGWNEKIRPERGRILDSNVGYEEGVDFISLRTPFRTWGLM
jgi:hypothetical protein